jgi:hypothetical protein
MPIIGCRLRRSIGGSRLYFRNSSCRTGSHPHRCRPDNALVGRHATHRPACAARKVTGTRPVTTRCSSRGIIVAAARVPAIIPDVVIIVGLVVCFIARIVADGAAPA